MCTARYAACAGHQGANATLDSCLLQSGTVRDGDAVEGEPANRVPSGLNSTFFSGTLQCHDSRRLGVIKQLGSRRPCQAWRSLATCVPTQVSSASSSPAVPQFLYFVENFHAGGLMRQSCSSDLRLPPLTW